MVSGRQKGSLTLPTAQLVVLRERGNTATSEKESRKKLRCTHSLLGGDELKEIPKTRRTSLDEKRLAGTRECAEGETPAASGANG